MRAGREAHYYVTDLGATLGRSGGFGGTRTKNNLKDFLSTRFVMGIEDGAVEFDYDTRPTKLGHLSVLYPPYYLGEVKKKKSMRGIPVEHARWIGSLQAQLNYGPVGRVLGACEEERLRHWRYLPDGRIHGVSG